ncbi:RloB family protein [Mucilaginibacter sp.]|uniref:RloB family protein n=1 Tax=Mucilaginibacter sp. TaxID=1882438 RepID=UPI0035644FBA
MGRPIKKRSGRSTVALVGDGFTEKIYFSDLKDTDRPEGLDIKPDYPRKAGSFKGVLERGISLKQDYSRVYALIDMDAIIAQGQQAVYQRLKIAAERKGVIVLENNPCFEMWLLLHFRPTGQHFGDCDEVSEQLERYIPGYDKSQRFQAAARLYANLRENIPQAIINARSLETDRADRDEHYPRAETFRFFEWYEGKRAR